MKNILLHPNRKRSLVSLWLPVATLAIVVSTYGVANAQPPLSFGDGKHISLGEYYADEGQLKNVSCSTGSGGGSINPNENAEVVWQFFADRGYPAHAIAGIIGNMYAESGVFPLQLLNDFPLGKPTLIETLSPAQLKNKLKDGGTAWGIVQFHPPQKLIDAIRAKGGTISDANIIDNQLIFLHAQLEGEHLQIDAIGADLKAIPDGPNAIFEATRLFAQKYERFTLGDVTQDGSWSKRLDAAIGAFARISPDIPAPGTPAGDGAVGEPSTGQPSYTASCAPASETGSVAAVAAEQGAKGGGDFLTEIPDGNAAEFVSWSFRRAGQPFTTGAGDEPWRIPSVLDLQAIFKNETGYSYIPVGSGDPLPGDVAFFIDPNRGIEHADIVVSFDGTRMTLVGADGNGSVVRRTLTIAEAIELGLDGFGRAASQQPGVPPDGNGGDNGSVASLNNPSGISQDCRGDTTNFSAAQVNALAQAELAGSSNCFMENASPLDNGSNGDGNFRLICTPSHFSYNDPIIFPGQEGKSHLHMFWGNTIANANTNFSSGSANNLLESGGSSCQGGPLNRSAYWTPAMISGYGPNAKVVMPEVITLYYKSKREELAKPLPQGIQLLVGNINRGGSVNSTFSADQTLSWGCYDPSRGQAVQLSSTIPGTKSAPCPNGWGIQASIQFPNCIQASGGRPILTHSDFISHTFELGENVNTTCPASHPYRVPQITYLIKWKNTGSTANWRLSSDAGFDQANPAAPGGSLHGDWLGGWQDDIINYWHEGCITGSRNCSLGQTGRPRKFKVLRGTNMDGGLMKYDGPQLLDINGGTGGGGSTGGGGAPTLPGGCITAGGYINPKTGGECVGAQNGASLPLYDGSTNARRKINVTSNINGKLVYGCIDVVAPNVTISNNRIICHQSRDQVGSSGAGYDGVIHAQSTNTTITNNDLICILEAGSGQVPCDFGIDGSNFVARYNDINGPVDGINPNRNVTAEYNYIHNQTIVYEEWRNDTSHADGFQTYASGAGNITIRGNFVQGSTSDLMGLQGTFIDLASGGVTIDKNRFSGSLYSFRIACTASSNCTITNNHIDDRYCCGRGKAVWYPGGGGTISGNKFINASGVVTGSVVGSDINPAR